MVSFGGTHEPTRLAKYERDRFGVARVMAHRSCFLAWAVGAEKGVKNALQKFIARAIREHSGWLWCHFVVLMSPSNWQNISPIYVDEPELWVDEGKNPAKIGVPKAKTYTLRKRVTANTDFQELAM